MTPRRVAYTPLDAKFDDCELTFNTTELSPKKKRTLNGSLMVSLIVNASLIAAIFLIYFEVWAQPTASSLLQSPLPKFPNEVRTFGMDPVFLSLPTEESNAAWDLLHGPNGRGFVNLEDPERYDYPDSKAGLSMFHQLHCLGALREFMWDLVYSRKDLELLLNEWPNNVTSPSYHAATHGLWHMAHCFDYLRQGIQCSGDTSLEFVSGHTGLQVVDGLDFPHVCKSWNAIWEYAELNG